MTAQSQAKPPETLLKHLQTPATSSRLNQIESIRANGVGDLIDLPQLVVCGDQSAGKSSVLEGITGIPFPRQEGLCTRFPSEIILRHSGATTSTTITARIRPHASRPADVKQTLAAYQRTVDSVSELPSVINDVSRLMRLRGYTDDDFGHAFSSDALRFEMTGPIGLHLSIVDLPGLISVPNEEQTQEDVEAVHEMARSYLQSSRTIILTVLQAGNDMANQPIIKLAREYDEDGQRTVGIITKPDLINEGAVSKIANAAKNQDSIKLKLGFFLLKNPTPTELKEGITLETRSRRELRFFSSPVWAAQGLDPNRLGADNLRLFLQDLLHSHIERELPKVREEIKKLLEWTDREIKHLGDARPSLSHIRSFLTRLSMDFYNLSQAALDGNYHSFDADFFSQDVACRLRAHIQEGNIKFASLMREAERRREVSHSPIRPGFGDDLSASYFGSADETTQLHVCRADMMQWVKEVYSRTRGRELPGNHNPALLCELFQEQSGRWRSVAQSHVDSVMSSISSWIRQAVQRLITEERLGRAVQDILDAWLDRARKLANDDLNRLMEDEKRVPMTYNHYYTDNVQKSRTTDQQAAVRKAIADVTQREWNGKLHISNNQEDINRFVAAVQLRIIIDMDEQACKDALTQLEAYYKVAMKTFVDNVARQVIERHIVWPLPDAFCPNFVACLSDEELIRIGSEPALQVQRREKLSKQASTLRQSLIELEKSFD